MPVPRIIQNLPRLAQIQAVPSEYPAERLPTFPALERTSVLRFEQNKATTVSGDGDTYFLICRSPVYPVWKTYTFTSSGIYHLFRGQSDVPYRTFYADHKFDYLDNEGSEAEQKVGLGTGPDLLPVMKDDEERTWFFVSRGMYFCVELELDFNATGGKWAIEAEFCPSLNICESTSFVTTADECTAGGSGSTGYINIAVPTAFLTIGVGGWVHLKRMSCLVSATSAPTTGSAQAPVVKVGVSTSPTGFAAAGGTVDYVWQPMFQSPPEFTIAPKIYSSARCNALGVLFQNVSRVVAKEGTVSAVRVCDATYALNEYAAPDFFNMVFDDSAIEDRYTGLLEKGFYAYAPPDQFTSNFHDFETRNFGRALKRAVQRDHSFAYYHLVRMVDYNATDPTNLFVSVFSHFEWRNTSMLWNIGLSRIPLEEWHRAQLVLMKLGFFFENPSHLSAIAALAKSAAMRLWPYVKPALQNAGRTLLVSAANTVTKKLLPNTSQTQVMLRSDRKTRTQRRPPGPKNKSVRARQNKRRV